MFFSFFYSLLFVIVHTKKPRWETKRSGCSKIRFSQIPPGFGFLRLFYTRWRPEPHSRGKIQDGARHENRNNDKKQSRITMHCTGKPGLSTAPNQIPI
jgi:hypothetical protein